MNIRKLVSNTKICSAVIVLSASVVITAAHAQDSGFYGSLGAVYATSNVDEIELVETDAGLIVVRAGYNVNRFLGIEAEWSFAALTPDFDPAGISAREAAVNFSRGLAGFVVARYPVSENIDIFARGGYHHTRIELRGDGIEQSQSLDNAAYGGGASYNWGRNGVRAEYTVYNISGENLDQRVFGLSFVRRF